MRKEIRNLEIDDILASSSHLNFSAAVRYT